MDWTTILTSSGVLAVFGAIVAGIFKLLDRRATGKVASQTELYNRMLVANAELKAEADASDRRADEFRGERDAWQDYAARCRRVLFEKGIEPPELPSRVEAQP